MGQVLEKRQISVYRGYIYDIFIQKRLVVTNHTQSDTVEIKTIYFNISYLIL